MVHDKYIYKKRDIFLLRYKETNIESFFIHYLSQFVGYYK